MKSNRFVSARMRQCETPDWKPLEELLGSDELCAHFMWMEDAVLEDGTVLNAYKHRWTRRYLHLIGDGRALHYVTDDLYREVAPHTAIKAAFARWDCCEPTLEERKALREALRRAVQLYGHGNRRFKSI